MALKLSDAHNSPDLFNVVYAYNNLYEIQLNFYFEQAI